VQKVQEQERGGVHLQHRWAVGRSLCLPAAAVAKAQVQAAAVDKAQVLASPARASARAGHPLLRSQMT
jgi:hypothetical protein